MSKKLKKYVPIVAAAFMLNLAGVVDVHALERVDVRDSTKNYGLNYYSSEADRIHDRILKTMAIATYENKCDKWNNYRTSQVKKLLSDFDKDMDKYEKVEYEKYINKLIERIDDLIEEYDPIDKAIQDQKCTTEGAVKAEVNGTKFYDITYKDVPSVNSMKEISAKIIPILSDIKKAEEELKNAMSEETPLPKPENGNEVYSGQEYAVEAVVLKMDMNGTEFSGIYDPRTKLIISIADENKPEKYKEVPNVKKTEDGQWSFTLDEAKPGGWIKIATQQEGKEDNHESYWLIEGNNKNFPGLAEIKEVCTNYFIKGTGPKGYNIKITRFKTKEDYEFKISEDGTWSCKFDAELIAGERIEIKTIYDKDNEEKLRYKITEDDLEKKDENKEDDKEDIVDDEKEEENSGENQGTDKEEGGNSGENQDTDKEEGGNSGENQGTDKEQEGNNVENQDSDKKDEENKEQNQGNNNNQSNNSGSSGSHSSSSSSSGSHGGSSGSHSSSSSSKNETNFDENDLEENVKKEVNAISENETAGNKLQIGWQFDGINDWSYIKKDKTKAVNCWLKIDGNWYNFDNNGVMRKNYWLKDKEKWYYLRPSGAMAIGWLKYNDKWYYFDRNGVMCTGWIQDNNNWYYLGQDGAMKTGWINVDNMWYYLDESGKMAVNTTINGYKINRHGIWVK